MYDDSENQNYHYDDELNSILNPDRDNETTVMRRAIDASQKQRKVRKQGIFLVRFRKFCRFLITLLVLYFTYRLMISSKWYLPKDTITSYEIKRIQIVGNRITPT